MTGHRVRRDLQERIVERLRRGDRIRLRAIHRSGSTFLRLGFRDGETVQTVSLESMLRRGTVQIDDDGEVRLT